MIVKKKNFGKKIHKNGKKRLVEKKKFKKPEAKNPPEILETSDIDENDKDLINFDIDASENEDETFDSTNNDIENIHIPSALLEVASDEEDGISDDDDDDDEDDDDEQFKAGDHTGKLTLKIIKEWQKELMQQNPNPKFIRNAMLAFNAALNSISDDESKKSIYKIENPAVFNATMQLCILYLHPSISKYLDSNQKSNKNIHKGEKWRKLKSSLRHYFTNLAGLIDRTSNSYMCIMLLKHLHQMSSFVSSFTVISKALLRSLISLWSTSQEDPVRVLSFLCILKITRSQQKALLNHVLKAMYIAYIRNCKFVSPNTLAGINFMRRSLTEIFLLDTKLAYQHAFLYIRQLAIHLRNAIILKKKQCFQAIHNWQYVNSIKLWAEMLSFSEEQPDLKPLVYPLVNLTIGLLKCTPTKQFYPLRFHCIKSLITITKQSNIFIPILPFIFEILKGNLFEKASSSDSIKAIDFTCLLRVSKTQINDNSFKKEVIDQICASAFEYLEHQSASLAFPDLVVPTVILLKKFIKNCKDANANRKLKQLLDKILENAKFIENERRVVTFALNETSKINAWEINIRNKGTPLSLYYKNWLKTNMAKKKRQAANTDEINEYKIPLMKSKKSKKRDNDVNINMDSDSDSDFFMKDDESENDADKSENDEEPLVEDQIVKEIVNKKGKSKEKVNIKEKSKKVKKTKKNKTTKEKSDKVNINDEVENLNIEDW